MMIFVSMVLQQNLYAQTGSFFNQRDDEYRLLGLKRAKEAYEEVINMNVSNDTNGLAYYKLAILYSESGRKEKAKNALRSALELTEREALIKKINSKLGSM